jgi:FMN reductase
VATIDALLDKVEPIARRKGRSRSSSNWESRMARRKPFIVGVGGTMRVGSTSERALRRALEAAAEMGAETEAFVGPAINLPPFDVGDRHRAAEAMALVDALRRADGVILSSPGYHGSISGLLKNAIDYAEDLRADRRSYLSERSVGLIVTADGIQAMGSTLNTLRSIVHALRGWPTPFGAIVNASARPFLPDGTCQSAEVDQSLRLVAAQVMEFAEMKLDAKTSAPYDADTPEASMSSAELSERMTAMEMTFRLMG